jgi:hypothetical protein
LAGQVESEREEGNMASIRETIEREVKGWPTSASL